jgi:hypothetical protein
MRRVFLTSESIGNARSVRLKRGVFFDPDYNRRCFAGIFSFRVEQNWIMSGRIGRHKADIGCVTPTPSRVLV